MAPQDAILQRQAGFAPAQPVAPLYDTQKVAPATFADTVQLAFQRFAESLHTAESKGMQAATHPASVDFTQLVLAINDADMALQTMVAVRDRMLGAYQEIMRMQV
jgi:flagellar hook-basal body complex protein FliE